MLRNTTTRTLIAAAGKAAGSARTLRANATKRK
jgi:hypothetical protein